MAHPRHRPRRNPGAIRAKADDYGQLRPLRHDNTALPPGWHRTRLYNITVASFYVENFGCRATQADGAALERDLLRRGLIVADGADQAQVVILNTCTVTASADQDVRSAIRRIHRRNPGCRILVTGCYAQRAPDEIARIPGSAP